MGKQWRHQLCRTIDYHLIVVLIRQSLRSITFLSVANLEGSLRSQFSTLESYWLENFLYYDSGIVICYHRGFIRLTNALNLYSYFRSLSSQSNDILWTNRWLKQRQADSLKTGFDFQQKRTLPTEVFEYGKISNYL